MAAPTSILAGLDVVASIGTTVIAGGRGATLSLSAEGIDLTTRDASNWATSVAGVRTWTCSFSGVLAKSAVISGLGLQLQAAGETVKGAKVLDIGFTSGTAQTANATEGYWAEFIGTRRTLTLSLEADSYDDASNDGGKELFNAYTSGGSVVIVATIASGTTITVNCRVANIKKGGEYEGIAATSYSLEAVAKPTFVTTGINASQLAVWTAFDTTAASAVQNLRFGPPTAPGATYDGWTYYTGDAIPTAFNITVNYTGEVALSCEWQGTGALASALVPAS
jgi:predicted secreted protein